MKPGTTGGGSNPSLDSGAEHTGGISSTIGCSTYSNDTMYVNIGLEVVESVMVSCQISLYAPELDLPAIVQIHQVQVVSLLDLMVDTPLVGQRTSPYHQWRLMAKTNTRFRVSRIVECS